MEEINIFDFYKEQLDKLETVAEALNDLACCRSFRANYNDDYDGSDEDDWLNNDTKELYPDDGLWEEPVEVYYSPDAWLTHYYINDNDIKNWCEFLKVDLKTFKVFSYLMKKIDKQQG